jgi:hypothetical protein
VISWNFEIRNRVALAEILHFAKLLPPATPKGITPFFPYLPKLPSLLPQG